jgi:hypothetical protein
VYWIFGILIVRALNLVLKQLFAPCRFPWKCRPCQLINGWTKSLKPFEGLRPLHTRDMRAHDHYTSSTLIGGKRRSLSKFTSSYTWGTNGKCECKMDGKVYMDSYVVLNGSCFMVTWIILKNHLLKVGLTQNQETMALWTLTTIDLVYFVMCKGPQVI